MHTIYRLHNIYLFFLLFFCSVFTLPATAQVSITASGIPITQNFDALPTTNTIFFSQNSIISGVYAERTGSGNVIVASDGSSGTSGLYSFGSALATDRALGSIGSGEATTGNFAYGWRLQNGTGATITTLQITYTGEQWRNSQATAQTISFSYLVSATPVTSLSATAVLPVGYTAIPALDFTGPVSGSTVVAGILNGNAAGNRVTKTALVSGLSIPPGAEILLRWYDADQVGSDHGLAIDDVSVVATTTRTTTNPTLSIAPATISALTTTVGRTSAPDSYTITGRNLTGPVTLSVTTGIEISNDPGGSIYTPAISITPVAGSVDAVVRVRLTGAAAGPVSATVTNASSTTAGALSGRVAVTGTVGNPVAIATTIARARTQPNGTSTANLPGGKIGGRVTVSNQFGGNLFYIQDVTGGISVFNSTTAVGSLVELGDSILVSGIINTYQGAREIDISSYTIVAGPAVIPVPKVVPVSQLSAYEGQLVQVQSTTIGGAGATLATTTYPLSSTSGTGTLSIRVASALNGVVRPTGAVNIVGITDHITSTTANTTALFPRLLADISGTSLSDQVCGGTGGAVLTTDQTFDISTWNIDFFGAAAGSITCTTAPVNRPYVDQGPADNDKQARNVSVILQKLNADVIVNEEVSDEVRYASVVRSLPGSYSYVCSEKFSNYYVNDCDLPVNSNGTVSSPAKFAQKVCVIYNTATVTPILSESQPLLTNSYSYPESTGWSSGRLPYLFVANVTINGQTRKMHMVGIHARTGTSTADYNRRKQDFADLKAELDRTYPNANLIMLGDYNDQISASTTVGQPSSFTAFDQDAARYQIITKPLDVTGCVTENSSARFVDHITISNELVQAYVGNSSVVLRPATGIEGPYASTTSDHNPVSARFNLAALQASLTVTLSATPARVTTGTTSLSGVVSGGVSPFSYTFTGPGRITASGSTASVASLTATGVQSFTVRVSDARSQTATAITSVTVTSGTGTVGNCDNLFVGANAGVVNTSGCNNVALGPQALATNRTGRNNVAVGESAGLSNNGTENTFVGYKSGLYTTTGNFNNYFGSQAGTNNTTGDYNLFMGASTGYTNTSGIYNTFVGSGAGYSNQIGSNNTFLGLNSGFKTTGSDNVMVGGTTGFENTGGSQNTFVGSGAGVSAANQNLVNATALGFRALVSTSNSVVLGNAANVGIGTSAPTAKLELVSGSAGTSGLKLTNLTSLLPTTLRTNKFLTVDEAGNVVLAATTNGARQGDADTTEVLWQRTGQFLRSGSGNAVVIGSRINKTPTGYKLFVEEGILTEKVKVALKNTSDWADYVFAPGYRLKPLAEVAAFIRANQHLPGIPSAGQVVKEGLDLGKMNATLLEKVEELTLYTIQLEQTNQKQQQELDALKQKQAQVEQLLQELIKRK